MVFKQDFVVLSEMDEVIQELDEDIDGMQGTICFWQDQLKKHKIKDTDIDPAKADAQVNNHHHHHRHRSSKSPSPAKSPRINPPEEEKQPAVKDVPAPEAMETENIKQEVQESEPLEPITEPEPTKAPELYADDSSSDRELQIAEPEDDAQSNDGIKDEPRSPIQPSQTEETSNPFNPAANTSSSMEGISDGEEDL